MNKEPKGENVSFPLFQAHESRRALYVIKYFVPLGKVILKWWNANYLWCTDPKKQKHLENTKESFPTFFNGAYKKRGASFVMWLGLLMDGVAQGRSNPI